MTSRTTPPERIVSAIPSPLHSFTTATGGGR